MLILHLLLAVNSVSNVFSKLAADAEFLSWQFVFYYGMVLAILAVYALGWQQVIKRMPLTTAYANKAVTIVWGIVYGMILFGEIVTPLMLLGALVIVAGIVLYAHEEGRVQEEAVREMNTQLAGRDVYVTLTGMAPVGVEDAGEAEGAPAGRPGSDAGLAETPVGGEAGPAGAADGTELARAAGAQGLLAGANAEDAQVEGSERA